tara:strand:- start:176 stop:454 length:279 start_codon:yes stop_codon:yes gene_type:complete
MVGNVAALKIDIMSQIVKASSKRLVSDSELANLFNINEVSVSDLKSHKFVDFPDFARDLIKLNGLPTESNHVQQTSGSPDNQRGTCTAYVMV